MLAVSDLPVPAWRTLRLLKVATPLVAVGCEVVPLRDPPPLRLRETVLLEIVLLNASVTLTVTAGENVIPAKMLEGASWRNWTELADAGTMLKALEVTLEKIVAGAEAV